MKLSELFGLLATGELSQVFLADTGGRNTVDDARQKPLAESIYLGLTQLHRRFPLKNKELTIELVQGRTNYPLLSKFAMSNTKTEDEKYIVDSEFNKFRDDILKIETVKTMKGYELPLNSNGELFNCSTPNPTTLVVASELTGTGMNLPDLIKTITLTVGYRANHQQIVPTTGFFNPQQVNIDLPQSHLQALLYFVASRVTNPTGMGMEFNSGNTWYQKYELECRQLEGEGMGDNSDLSSDRFRRKGWA